VPGEDYALFVHVPEGMAVSRALAIAAGGREVPVRQELSGRSLKVSFRGQPEIVAWRLEFTAQQALGRPRDLSASRTGPLTP
jgi:hypothetical protein